MYDVGIVPSWDIVLVDAKYCNGKLPSPCNVQNLVEIYSVGLRRGQLRGYFGEVDHLIPWQIDHLNVWRPVAEKSRRSSFKIS